MTKLLFKKMATRALVLSVAAAVSNVLSFGVLGECDAAAPPAGDGTPQQWVAQAVEPASANRGPASGLQRRGESRVRRGVSALAISPDGALLGATSDDKTIRLLDARTGQQRVVLPGHLGAEVTGVTFSSDS